jgi:hypothetical protein
VKRDKKQTLRMRSSVVFWKRRISRSATVPGRKRWGFLTPPMAGALLREALVASCLRGSLPPEALRAVCLVRALYLDQSHKNGVQNRHKNVPCKMACMRVKCGRHHMAGPFRSSHAISCVLVICTTTRKIIPLFRT